MALRFGSRSRIIRRRERYAVRPPHLHFCARNAPLAIRQIKLGPFGLPKLTGSDKDQWGQLEGISGDRLTFEAIDGSEQGARRSLRGR